MQEWRNGENSIDTVDTFQPDRNQSSSPLTMMPVDSNKARQETEDRSQLSKQANEVEIKTNETEEVRRQHEVGVQNVDSATQSCRLPPEGQHQRTEGVCPRNAFVPEKLQELKPQEQLPSSLFPYLINSTIRTINQPPLPAVPYDQQHQRHHLHLSEQLPLMR